jgi:predicted nucleic acid-binding protein
VILVDTSIWIDHLRTSDGQLVVLLEAGRVLAHPFVTGEIALGRLRQRDLVLSALADLPRAEVATHEEVRQFIDRNALFGAGIGYVDAHLLAAVRLTAAAALWTKDKRLHLIANRLGLAMA